MRLNKYLSAAGGVSRRQADKLIKSGKVLVNRRPVNEIFYNVDERKDKVFLAGKKVAWGKDKVYVALNKPKGYVCTHANFRGERSIFQLLPRKYKRLKIAGRLDKNSEGLLLLSSDGDFIYQLTHPKFRHDKEYEVKLGRKLKLNELLDLKKGIFLEEGRAKFDRIIALPENSYRLVLHQGWKRQIRRMLANLHLKIISLRRVRIAGYKLGQLPVGKFKRISKEEILADK